MTTPAESDDTTVVQSDKLAAPPSAGTVASPPPGWDLPCSPFNEGERAVQARAGVREKMEVHGRRVIRRYLTPQHQAFFPQLPIAFLGSVDDTGQPWASPLFGRPGFVTCPDEMRLDIAARPLTGDPLNETLREGRPVALLGIELPTRRRNRVIGHAINVGHNSFAIGVHHTLGICAKYIQARQMGDRPANALAPAMVHHAVELDPAAQAIIARADTFFIASADPREEDGLVGGADVSHRGGRPGFVRIDDASTLTTPDFLGNFMFNTLGNLALDDRAGLLFLDFEGGGIVHIAARAEVVWDGPELEAFAGAQRLVRFHIERVVRLEAGLPFSFGPPEYSPVLEHVGDWTEAARKLDGRMLDL